MTPMEIFAISMMCGAMVIAFSILWKFKRMHDDRVAMDKAEAKAKLDRKRVLKQYTDIKKPAYFKQPSTNRNQSQTVGNNSVGVQSGSSATVSTDNSSDLMTAALLYSMMSNNSNKVSARYDDDTGKIETKTYEEPKQESSYTSSYNSDDSKSTYSSSYTSDSSDSSYTSSYDSSSSSSD